MDSERRLHIICHDVPYPPDYGGVVDLFFKIRYLHQEGIRIDLHCYTKQRQAQPELEKYCDTVHYYRRSTGVKGLSPSIPYIVSSRMSQELFINLNKDAAPILMEGIHCTGFVQQLNNQKRKIFLRLHNVEHKYYKKLFDSEENVLRKMYFFLEYRNLKKYEKNLDPEIPVIAVSQSDASYYVKHLGKKNVHHIPVFVPFSNVRSSEGIGTFCLYHGNLSVAENEKAARWLLDDVFSKNNLPIVIAGKSPSLQLQNKIKAYKNARLVADPNDSEMEELIREAQIHVLPSFNDTGVKLKLVHALFEGKHCVVNKNGVMGSGMEQTCHIANNATAFASIVSQLFRQPFTTEEVNLRRNILHGIFNNVENARRFIQLIY